MRQAQDRFAEDSGMKKWLKTFEAELGEAVFLERSHDFTRRLVDEYLKLGVCEEPVDSMERPPEQT